MANESSSSQGSPGEELFVDGMAFYTGIGKPKDDGMAAAKLLDAADLGCIKAMLASALIYFIGVGVGRNIQSASEYAHRCILAKPKDSDARICREIISGELGTHNAIKALQNLGPTSSVLSDPQDILYGKKTVEGAAQNKKLVRFAITGAGLITLATVAYFVVPIINKHADFNAGQTTLPAVPQSAVEVAPQPAPIAETVSTAISLDNIKTVIAPTQTAGLLTEMLLNNSSFIKLADAKSKIEEFPKQEKGDVKVARTLNENGLAAFRQANYIEAARVFYEASKANPADVEIINNYAYALLKSGNYPQAEQALGLVLSYAPSRTSAWANLGELYAYTLRMDAAAAAFLVGFQFSGNKEKALQFLKNTASDDPNENLRFAITKALNQLSN